MSRHIRNNNNNQNFLSNKFKLSKIKSCPENYTLIKILCFEGLLDHMYLHDGRISPVKSSKAVDKYNNSRLGHIIFKNRSSKVQVSKNMISHTS